MPDLLVLSLTISVLWVAIAPPLISGEWLEKRNELRMQSTLDKAKRAVTVVYGMPIGRMNDSDSVYHKVLYCRQWIRHLEALPINQMTARQVMLRDQLALKLRAREDQFAARFLELEDINRSETRFRASA